MNSLTLEGTTVVELGDSAAAPFCGQILGDLGADVIKIERPGGGDPSRQWGNKRAGLSPTFAALNRNKRSAVVDLKDPAQLARLHALLRDRADVFLHNLRPGSAGNFGLDGAALVGANPRLVYCGLGAFGSKGPLARAPGYDPLMQAFGGIMSATGEEDRPPVRVGVSIIDFGAGMWCAIGILAALKRRDATGQGGIVDTSLFETALSWMTLLSADFLASGEKPQRLGSGTVITAPYRAYAVSDGHLIVAAPNDRLFAKLAHALGRPQWISEERFASTQARLRNRDLLDAAIGGVMAGDSRAAWMRKLEQAGVPNAPLQDIEEVHAHPQTAALEMLLDTSFGLRLMGLPLSFDGQRPPLRREPPAYGEHTAEVFGPSRAA